MGSTIGAPLVAVLIVSFGLILAAFIRSIRRAARQWSVVAEGAFAGADRKSTVSGGYLTPSLWAMRPYRLDTTRVRFQDGTSHFLDGLRHPDFPPGTRVRILRNGLGEMRIESAES
jgi:hypothetical protein